MKPRYGRAASLRLRTTTSLPPPPVPPRTRLGAALILLLAAVAVGVLILAGGARAADPSSPREIRYGEDSCTRCGMVISDPAHAAAFRTTSGEVRLFDDVGEMFVYQRERGELVAAFFVHDYASRVWLRGEDAYYVSARDLQTPMGSGLVAVASEATAQALADRVGGKVLRFEEALVQVELPKGGKASLRTRQK